ncbi:MAG: hypothetical protein KatS3mg105_0621 [Gemmatales bacterium]|nr:MAG: hypothetical protein KatS3mg105_0621 [Gemmatales bacterium]
MRRLIATIVSFFMIAAHVSAQGFDSESLVLQPEAGETACGQKDCCDFPCGPEGRIWGRAELLLWWIRGGALPPLVTTSPAGTPQAQAGVLGTPGAAVVFGNTMANENMRTGGRFTIGTWLDCDQTIGIEGYYFTVGSQASPFLAGSNGTPILARPFFDVTTGQASSELVAFPGVLTGSVAVVPSTSGLVGSGFLLRENLCCGCNYRLDIIGGYRFLRFNDDLAITENLVATGASRFGVAPGTNIIVFDRFSTRNEFHGFDLGIDGEIRRGVWFCNYVTKLAFGNVRQTLAVGGATIVTPPGGPTAVNAGGLLALSSNSGTFRNTQYTFVPEFRLRVGRQLGSHLRVHVGYTFLYVADVLRAGDQIDLAVNPNLLPPVAGPVAGPNRPLTRLTQTDLWAQGIDLGLEWRY